jgi:hypothetical protein
MDLRQAARNSRLYRPYLRVKFRLSSHAREELFTGFYRDNIWGDAESRSGDGSSFEQTERLRAELPAVLHRLGVASMLDVPCGDFTWMQYVDLHGIHYIGGDVVQEIVEDLQARFGRADRRFVRLDLINGDLPHADAVMVRDLLLHLPNVLAVKALQTIKRSDARWLLASHYPGIDSNPDVEMGRHRFPNLTLEPFCLPAPYLAIDEQPASSDDSPHKQLAVWPVSALPS